MEEIVKTNQVDISVDINDPLSILSFGNDIKENVSELLTSTAAMSVQQENAYLSEDMLNKIVTFDESLEEVKSLEGTKPSLIGRAFDSLKGVFGGKKAHHEPDMKTYQGRYEDYTVNLNMVRDQASKMANNALQDIQLRKDITAALTPEIERAQTIVAYGYSELEKYEQETLSITPETNDLDTQNYIARRAQLSDAFREQLNGLEKAVILYKAQIQEYAQQQGVDMITVMECKRFITDQAPILQAQASVQIFNTTSSQRLSTIKAMNEAANTAIQESAKKLEENVVAATDLLVNGGFNIETITKVQESLQRGVTIIKNGKKALKEKIAQEKVALDKINNLLEENNKEVLALLEDSANSVLVIESKETKPNTRKWK